MAAAESLTGGIKDLLTIEIKPRHDPVGDQYNRMFMVKVLLVCTMVIGFDQFKDTLSCILPESLEICGEGDDGCDFISAACWIQGMYVYKQLIDKVDDVAYFGMPKNIGNDGILKGSEDLCTVQPNLHEEPNENCIPMTKTFYLQYQWMSFFVASLAVMYYLPYVLFCKVNKDMISLRGNMKEDEVSSEEILNSYFKSDATTKVYARVRIALNLLIKVLYVCVNVISFLALDSVLNGEFFYYGKRWVDWSRLNNTVMYDYMGMRDFPKPGNRLLPPFGFCEFYESARDIKHTWANKVRVVCEISPHMLYQYCLILLWFCIVGGITISAIGLISLACTYVTHFLKTKRNIFFSLTVREMEYITYIKTRDNEMYGDILRKIKEKGQE